MGKKSTKCTTIKVKKNSDFTVFPTRPPIFVEKQFARKTQNFDYFARKNRKIIYYIDAAKKEKISPNSNYQNILVVKELWTVSI